jgi:hypothetical protein
VAQIGKGEAVVAVTGVVETRRPGLIRLDRDLEGSNLKRGVVILTYAYRGEGINAVHAGFLHIDPTGEGGRKPDLCPPDFATS